MNYVSLELAYPNAFMTSSAAFDLNSPEYQMGSASNRTEYQYPQQDQIQDDIRKKQIAQQQMQMTYSHCNDITQHMKTCPHCRMRLKKIIQDEMNYNSNPSINNQNKPSETNSMNQMNQMNLLQSVPKYIYNHTVLSIIFVLIFIFLLSIVVGCCFRIEIKKR